MALHSLALLLASGWLCLQNLFKRHFQASLHSFSSLLYNNSALLSLSFSHPLFKQASSTISFNTLSLSLPSFSLISAQVWQNLFGVGKRVFWGMAAFGGKSFGLGFLAVNGENGVGVNVAFWGEAVL
jgi:hypothetical protein